MRKILQKVCMLICLIGYMSTVFAQGPVKQITGTVNDDTGSSLPGATVNVKGTQISVITDINGKYTINAPTGASTLIFTFVGMAEQQVAIGSQSTINVVLKQKTSTLNDVVVIGYGSQKKSDINGAIASVTAKDIENIPQVSIDQLLQGKASGLTITANSGAPGSNTSVHIRGISSLSSSNEPIYVIDGVVMSGDATNKSTSGRSVALAPNNGENGVSPLALINPNDIEDIQVLKDASAAAIYGAQASNGVILITTKRGKNGQARISYDGYYGIQQQPTFLPMMNLQQYASLQNALADNINVARRGEFADPSLLGSGVDWQRAIFKTAGQQSHQVSFSGANNGSDYYISGGYLKQDGTIINNNFERYTFRTNVNSQVKPWFKVGTSITGSRAISNSAISNNGGLVYLALLSAPDQAIYNADGSFAGPTSDAITNGAQINPVARANDLTNILTRSNLTGSGYADLRFFKDLTLRSELNGDFNYGLNRVFNPSYQYGGYGNPTATLQEYASTSTYWAWKEYLTYSHNFAKKHDVTFLAGHEATLASWGGTTEGVSNFLSNNLQTLNLGDAKTATVGEYKDASATESLFGRLTYNYNNRYGLTATLRSDKSSKFAPGHQTGYFPSAAVSWRLSEEPFMAGIKKYADNIKLRLGYGQVGNQNVPNYLYGSALNSFATGLGTGFAVDKVANPNLTWETAIQTDAGIDFQLFNGRIDATFDYFDKTSKNFLFQTPLPAFLLGGSADYSGTGVINSPYVNAGQLTNKGFDFNITSHNIESKSFTWNTSLVFSRYANKIVSLANGLPSINYNVTVSFLNLPVTRTQVGLPVGEFYGYKVKGLFRTDAQLRSAPIQFGRPVANNSGGTWLGDVQFEDTNGDGKIDANDQVPLGDPSPKFTYGFTNTFAFKGFDLSVFLNGSYGAKIFNVLNYQIAGLSGRYQNQLASSANFWTPSNPNSNIPAPRSGDNPNLLNSDRFIESGSFLRIQNATLGYTVPNNLTKKLQLSRLHVYVGAQNLYTFTPYKGLDPEVGSVNQNVFLTGIDLGRYPSPRTITFGINASF
jgi:TonB-linked SusC/RagA family outer membrane protein